MNQACSLKPAELNAILHIPLDRTKTTVRTVRNCKGQPVRGFEAKFRPAGIVCDWLLFGKRVDSINLVHGRRDKLLHLDG
jgi:hypothetical protein